MPRRRISYEEMVHRKPSLPSLNGGGVRGTLITLTQWVLILQVHWILGLICFIRGIEAALNATQI